MSLEDDADDAPCLGFRLGGIGGLVHGFFLPGVVSTEHAVPLGVFLFGLVGQAERLADELCRRQGGWRWDADPRDDASDDDDGCRYQGGAIEGGKSGNQSVSLGGSGSEVLIVWHQGGVVAELRFGAIDSQQFFAIFCCGE